MPVRGIPLGREPGGGRRQVRIEVTKDLPGRSRLNVIENGLDFRSGTPAHETLQALLAAGCSVSYGTGNMAD
ncbi:MAG: hypothetical protein JXD23_04385 [Spirochaetales bacterium]|nr:hypothetical protein [Spirochaetales bacterium]